MEQITYWIETEGSGHWFFYAFPCVLLLLFILLRGRRVKFLIPCVLITIVIVNPLFYEKWSGLGLYSYWRILWVVPIIPIVATLIPAITEKIRLYLIVEANVKKFKTPVSVMVVKSFITAFGVGIVIFGGTFLYNGTGGSFVEAVNSAKVPDYVVQIADYLLEIDDHPRVVFQNPIGTYVRQYTGEIDQLYGRDIDGFILGTNKDAQTIYNALNDPNADLNIVATMMANDEYRYLVIDGIGREEVLAAAGFEKIDTVAEYGIYKVHHGVKTQLKQRNELGQVMSITNIDENGQPVNGESGYATIAYDYDQNGLIIREFRTDINGNGVADNNGRAGFEREYDSCSHLLMERWIDPDGKAVMNDAGYAEYRCDYQGSDLISESYYDTDGQLVNRNDTGYAIIRMSYDGEKNRIGEYYYNTAGELVVSSAGYAIKKRTYDQTLLTSESYFGIDTKPVKIFMGYSSKICAYDSMGNMTSESYYNEAGESVNNINGYSKVEYEYDSEKNVILQRFRDKDGQLVVTGSGYAEVHRVYEGKHLIHEEYYGVDGKYYFEPAGYVAINQEWQDDVLVSRTYLDENGKVVNRTDGYAVAVWENEETCTNLHLYDTDGSEIELDSINLVCDVRTGSDGWSDWIAPDYYINNSTQNIGFVNLGTKTNGDIYTCTIEIEFKNVICSDERMFRFMAQGAQDGRWDIGNVWNSNLINLKQPPESRVYRFTSIIELTENMAKASNFNIGFRCDYWKSGVYRVRFVNVQKGSEAKEWSPGL